MIWLRPSWLLALLPLALLLWWCWQRRPAGSGWQKLLPPHLAKHLLVGKDGAQSRWPLAALALAWLLGTLALAGPSWEQDQYPLYQLKGGRVLVMDMSLSMRATDLAPDRLTQAKYKAIDLVRRLNEGETGLVAYAASAYTIAPLTRDGATLEHLLQALSSEIMPAQGSRADLGVVQAIELLQQAGYRRGDILLFTDGLNPKENRALANLDLGPFNLSTLVFGTEAGAPIRTLSGELLKDGQGQVIIPQSRLSDTCGAVNGLCIKAGLDDGDLNALLTRPDSGQTQSDEVMTLPKDGGRYLLWLLLPLALLAFRRGLLVLALVAVLPQPSHAALFKNQGQEAYQQYQAKDYAEAANQFSDPNWQAAALYRAGHYQDAAALWQDQPGAQARYNQGNALAKAGDTQGAIGAYQEALAEQPDFADARFNLDLLNQQQDQQQQGQGDQGDESSGQKEQDQKPGDQGQQPGDQSDADKGKPQDQGDNAQKPKEPDAGQQGDKDAGAKDQPKPQGNEQGQEDDKPSPQGADDKGKDQGRQQKAGLAKGEGDPSQGPMLNSDKLLDAVNDDPGYLLQQKMRRAYEAQAKHDKEEEQW